MSSLIIVSETVTISVSCLLNQLTFVDKNVSKEVKIYNILKHLEKEKIIKVPNQ